MVLLLFLPNKFVKKRVHSGFFLAESVRLVKPQITDGDLRTHIINYLKNCGTNYSRREAKHSATEVME